MALLTASGGRYQTKHIVTTWPTDYGQRTKGIPMATKKVKSKQPVVEGKSMAKEVDRLRGGQKDK